MRVSVLLTVDVPSTASFEHIERACVQVSRRAGVHAIGQLLERMERRRRRRARKGRGRPRTVLSRLGYLTYRRGRGRRAARRDPVLPVG